MDLNTLVKKLDIETVVGVKENSNITNGHVGDLLSEVMRNAKENSIWITHQAHQNIIAVAEVVGARVIVIVEGINYQSDTIEKAKENNICLLKTDLDAFSMCGKIYKELI